MMNQRLIHGLIAGALIGRSLELIPGILFPNQGFDSSWWASIAGFILPLILGAGLLRYGKLFVIPNLIFSIAMALISIYMICAITGPPFAFLHFYIPVAVFYIFLSILLIILLRISPASISNRAVQPVQQS